MNTARGAWKGRLFGFSLVGGVALLALTGCPGVPVPDDGNGDGDGGGGSGTTGSTNAQIIVPSNFGISEADSPISIQYSVPDAATDIRAFAVEVESGGADAAAIGDPDLIASGLAAGGGQAFTFDPSEVGIGFFRIRLTFIFNAVEEVAESVSAIEVQGSPSPVFVRPTVTQLKVVQGTDVAVSFDAGDPQGEVMWRLFYLRENDPRDTIPSALGVELVTGSGNAGVFTWSTNSVPPGVYELGVSATDSGSSVASTASAGEIDRIKTIPSATVTTPRVEIISPEEANLPLIQITSPGKDDVRVFQDQDFKIEWNATVFAEGATGTVEVFYDTDTNAANGFVSIKKNLSLAVSSVDFPAGVAEGEYFIGATIRDGVNAPQTAYSEGTLEVVRGVFLQVTSPDTSLPVPPGTFVSIAWTTNAPQTAGTVKVVYQTIFRDGGLELPFGEEVDVFETTDLSIRSTRFKSDDSGLFKVSVQMRLGDGTELIADAPQLVQFSTLPGIIYLGSLADACTNDPQNTTLPRCAGAIFGGVNFEDNAGSALTTAGDLNGDGLDEFVIASRYGKPDRNFEGRGDGEAYVIYGRSVANRLSGEFNLNSVGTRVLTGVAIAGMTTSGNCGGVNGPVCASNADCESDQLCLGTVDTDGLASIANLPDVDGDGNGELAFVFPRTNSVLEDPMAIPGQLLPGGIVILSSTNSILVNPDSGPPLLDLTRVGRNFEMTVCSGGNSVGEACDEDADCGGDNTCDLTFPAASLLSDDGTWVAISDEDAVQFILDDLQRFDGDACAPGSDQVNDTIVGPSIGFRDMLAKPAWEQRGFDDEGGACETTFALANCEGEATPIPFSGLDSGSGYYPRAAVPFEPFGARLIGSGALSHFGTSLTVAPVVGLDLPDLIVTAPVQQAGNGPTGGGVAHIFQLSNLWDSPGDAPTPHQYLVDTAGFCGDDRRGNPGSIRIMGDANDRISNVVSVSDFNGDLRNDFAVGAPNANGMRGRVYIAYRRERQGGGLEGEFELDEIGLDPTNPNRAEGFLLMSSSPDQLGFGLASGFDFNGDGVEDVAVSSPTANDGVGEVIILFGQAGATSPLGGFDVEDYLSQTRSNNGRPVAARITGATVAGDAGRFGFNIRNAGDLDGDGTDDLLVAAPEATPHFDPDPSDEVDVLSEPGVDRDRDGVADEVPGGRKECKTSGDACSSDADCDPDESCISLRKSGLVYVIFGSNRLDNIKECQTSGDACSSNADCGANESCIWTDVTIDIGELGSRRLQGFILVGRHAGDRLGGGDAGVVADGGNVNKAPLTENQSRGRSHGLGSAGDVDGDGRADLLIGAILADPRRSTSTPDGVRNGGEAYLIYGSNAPAAGGQ